MSDETDTTSLPQASGFKIPTWLWVTGSAVLIGIIVLAVVLLVRGSSDDTSGGEETEEEEEEEEEGEGEEPEQEDDLKTAIFTTNNTPISLIFTRDIQNDSKLLIEFEVPNESKQAQELSLEFNRTPTGPNPAAAVLKPEYFNYLIYNVLDTNEKTTFDSWKNCENEEWITENCQAIILYDFVKYDWQFKRAELKFDRSDQHGISFLDKLKPGFTVKIYMRIYGYIHAGDISDIETKLTYQI